MFVRVDHIYFFIQSTLRDDFRICYDFAYDLCNIEAIWTLLRCANTLATMQSLMLFQRPAKRTSIRSAPKNRPSRRFFCGWLSGSHSLLRNGLLLLNYPSDALSPVIKAIYSHRVHGVRCAIRDRLSNRTEKQDAFEADQGVEF